MRSLVLWETYSREEAHDIFAPHTAFTPQSGTWGLQGIVAVPDSPGDFVFFVTFGRSQGDHDFDENISKDGVLTWQSQPRQQLDSLRIQQFIRHDDLKDSIHLFLRTSALQDYTSSDVWDTSSTTRCVNHRSTSPGNSWTGRRQQLF